MPHASAQTPGGTGTQFQRITLFGKMKGSPLVFFLAAALSFVGCDGHFRALYVSPLGSSAPRGGFGSTVIRIEGSEDVLGIVERVARELGLQPDPKEAQRWFVRTTYNNSFMLSVKKEPAGHWLISLGDWPTIGRSEESKRAEELIRAALKKAPNKAARANAVTVPQFYERSQTSTRLMPITLLGNK